MILVVCKDMKIAFVKFSGKAVKPSQAHDFDAGYDLYSSDGYTLQP